MLFQTHYRRSLWESFDGPFALHAPVCIRQIKGFELFLDVDPGDEEQEKEPRLIVIATTQEDVPVEIANCLRKPPATSKASDSGLAAYPSAYRDFLAIVAEKLDRQANLVIESLLWRCGVSGRPLPPKTDPARLRWGEDDEHTTANGFLQRQVPSGPRFITVPQERVLAIDFETLPVAEAGSWLPAVPLGHELLREAFRNQRDNTRSAVVMAVAAAETAMKELVVTLAPETRWLMENIPSPPLDKIIREYLEQLPANAPLAE